LGLAIPIFYHFLSAKYIIAQIRVSPYFRKDLKVALQCFCQQQGLFLGKALAPNPVALRAAGNPPISTSPGTKVILASHDANNRHVFSPSVTYRQQHSRGTNRDLELLTAENLRRI
jgi:hypothetical protein